MKPPCFPFTGHDLLAVERFHDDTRHMLEFQVLSENSPYGGCGQYVRLFLSEDGYAQAAAAQRRGGIHIMNHAHIIEGHILPEKPKSGAADNYGGGKYVFCRKSGDCPVRPVPPGDDGGKGSLSAGGR